MSNFFVFLKKEIIEGVRTGKFLLILITFTMLGLMNPFIAKLKPFFYEQLMVTANLPSTVVEVTGIDAWQQFYKNIPIALIVLVFIFSNSISNEYSTSSLAVLKIKGLNLIDVVLCKYIIYFLSWSVGFWISFSITSFYTNYYWSTSELTNIFTSAGFWYLFGIFIISIEIFAQTFSKNSSFALLLILFILITVYITGLFEFFNQRTPFFLLKGLELLTGNLEISDMLIPSIITIGISLVSVALACLNFSFRWSI